MADAAQILFCRTSLNLFLYIPIGQVPGIPALNESVGLSKAHCIVQSLLCFFQFVPTKDFI